jgi:AAA domain
MPIIKKEEPLKERPVILVIYGGPGLGKTSLFNTTKDPILLDFDRGVDRSLNRQDTLAPLDWEEVMKEDQAGTFKNYKTVGIDTAKAALDDFLMMYVRKIDAKNRVNKLAAYGAIGDEFKIFINNRRQEAADIVIIAHSKEEKEGDINKFWPDVTGQSYQLLLRIADQVGYIYTKGNKRMICFEPTDATKGKNVAQIPETEIPDFSSPDYKTFLGDLIERVRKSLAQQTEAQKEAEELVTKYRTEIEASDSPETLTDILVKVNELPLYFGAPLKKLISETAAAKKYKTNKELRRFELPAEEAKQETGSTAGSNGQGPGLIFTSLEERRKELEAAGAISGNDGLNYGKEGKTFIAWEALERLTEEEFNFVLKAILGKKRNPAKAETGK